MWIWFSIGFVAFVIAATIEFFFDKESKHSLSKWREYSNGQIVEHILYMFVATLIGPVSVVVLIIGTCEIVSKNGSYRTFMDKQPFKENQDG